ncbi:hypothetical protein WG915_10805 [Corynebacterium sp. H128]|uniref:hypothetical protein n=1 Tax=Corynebacterium sp. H128 TaxID=3133427 RepID=UPI00309E326D
MGISMSLDLGSATLAELAALVDAAQAAGVSMDTVVRVDAEQLTIDVGEVIRPEVVEAEEVAGPHISAGADAVRDTVRQVLGEEAVRNVIDSLILKNSQRKS